MSRVLVTGAAGFVGQALIPALAAAGHETVAVVRSSPGPGQRVVPDIGPDTDWGEALDGIEAVVHLAARVHVQGESGAEALTHHRRTNRDGTRHLTEAAARAGVKRFVFLSTVKAMGERSPGRPLIETDLPEPEDAYGISKLEAERALAEVAASTPLETVILRPPLVYGAGVRANFLSLMTAVGRGLPLPLGGIASRRSLLYLGNLIDGITRVLTHPAAAGETFLIRDGEDASIAELVRKLGRAMDRPARLIPIPPIVLRTAGAATGQGDTVRRLVDPLEVNDDKLRHLVGWVPPYSLEQGLAETAVWYRAARDRTEETKSEHAV